MEFFDKLTKKASETYKGAAEKTGKIAKETKLKLKMSENKSKINDIYEEIGKKVYQKHISDEELCIKKDLEEECTKIDILSSEIETYNREILALSNLKECVECKEKLQKDAKFCTKCGAKQPEEEPENVLEAEVLQSPTENAEEIKEEFQEGCKKDVKEAKEEEKACTEDVCQVEEEKSSEAKSDLEESKESLEKEESSSNEN